MITIRNEIHNIINNIFPFDELEHEHILFAKNWINSGAEIFRITKPAIPDPHLVSYFLLIDPETKQILLVDHKKSGLWLPAGGHVEPNEHPMETVKREVKEELGIGANFLMKDPFFLTVTQTVGQIGSHIDISLWYILKGYASDRYLFDKEEFHQIRWFFPFEIPYVQSDPHMMRCMEKLNFLKLLEK